MPNPIMKFFEYAHLPEKLQSVSKSIGDLATQMDASLPDCAEKSAGLRKLLEAKDCLVRAALPVLLAFIMLGCAAQQNGEGGLSDSEVIIITAAVRSGAAIGCDQVKSEADARSVAESLRIVRDVLDDGDFTSGVDVLQERISLSLGQTRAVLNAVMVLRALIPTEALAGQHITIFDAGLDECVIVLEAKFPEIKPSILQRTLGAVGL